MRRSLHRFLAWAILDRTEHPRRRSPRRRRRGPARDAKYRAWIRTLPCAACETTERVEAAHTGSDGGMSMKASDYSCVPLCRDCHTLSEHAYHRLGRAQFERVWFLEL
jgi:hypothetical protein